MEDTHAKEQLKHWPTINTNQWWKKTKQQSVEEAKVSIAQEKEWKHERGAFQKPSMEGIDQGKQALKLAWKKTKPP